MAKKTPLRRRWFMWAIISLVCILVGFELLVRYTHGAPRSERLPLLRVKPDPQLGYKPLSRDLHYGYDQLVQLNTLGFRGPEISEKRDQEVRIVLVGETQAYGLGIADHELATHVLQQTLNESVNTPCFRALNLGVRAYTLNQQRILLENAGIDLAPDHVVVLFYVHSFGQSDIKTVYQRMRDRDWYMLDLKSKPNGSILLKWKTVQLARRSALLAWGNYQYKQWRNRDGFVGALLDGNAPIPPPRIDHLKEQLIRLNDSAHKHRFTLTIALLPHPQQLVREFPTEQYQSLLQRLASQQGIAFLDLLPSLKKLYRQTRRLPTAPFDDHFDAAAHNTMGTELARFLLERYPSTISHCR